MLLSGALKQTSDHRQHLLCVRARSKRELWEGLGYLLHVRMYVTAYVIQVASTFAALHIREIISASVITLTSFGIGCIN